MCVMLQNAHTELESQVLSGLERIWAIQKEKQNLWLFIHPCLHSFIYHQGQAQEIVLVTHELILSDFEFCLWLYVCVRVGRGGR